MRIGDHNYRLKLSYPIGTIAAAIVAIIALAILVSPYWLFLFLACFISLNVKWG